MLPPHCTRDPAGVSTGSIYEAPGGGQFMKSPPERSQALYAS